MQTNPQTNSSFTKEDVYEYNRAVKRNKNRTDGYNLTSKLAILLKTRNESKYLCTATSIAFRVAALCDLVINDYIKIENNKVETVKSHKNQLYNEILIKISQINGDTDTVIKSLNGEKKRVNGIKNFKKKVYKDLSVYLERKGGILNNKIVLKDTAVWKGIFDEIVDECVNREERIETNILLLCLEYINNMSDILIQLPKDKANAITISMQKSKNKLVSGEYLKENDKNKAVFKFLKFLCKSKMILQ